MSDTEQPGYPCSVRARRAAMTDEEFWDDVYADHAATDPGIDDRHPDLDVPVAEPCPVCGAAGACGWDTEGRPLIHAVSDEEDER